MSVLKEGRIGGLEQDEAEAGGSASTPPLQRALHELNLLLPQAYFLLGRVQMLFNLPGRCEGSAPPLTPGR